VPEPRTSIPSIRLERSFELITVAESPVLWRFILSPKLRFRWLRTRNDPRDLSELDEELVLEVELLADSLAESLEPALEL